MYRIINSIKTIFLKLIRVLFSPLLFIFDKLLSVKGLEKVKAAIQTPEIQKKIFITVFLIGLFRMLAAIPLPGVDINVYNDALNANTGNALSNLWTLATGGNIDAPSLAVIGLGSYINSSIIVQLLTTVIPKLEELSKEGDSGRRTISQITRLLTLPLSLVQGFVIFTVIKNNSIAIPGSTYTVSELVSNLTPSEIAVMILAIAAGSILLMYISELITENGIGNGSSIIITVGILSTLPGLLLSDFSETFKWFIEQIKNGELETVFNGSMVFIYALFIGFILMVGFIVFISEATRKIKTQYARRVRGSNVAESSYLPFKINQAGVMPIIFASSILTFPTIIAQFITSSADTGSKLYEYATKLQTWKIFDLTSNEHILLYFVMIFLFTFFYTFVVTKPEQTSENLQKGGAFIPGIRPGVMTTKYITSVLIRLTFLGALFLSALAISPTLLGKTDQGANLLILSAIGGTSILIIVGVILDTVRQMNSLTVTRSYEMYK